jgi:methyl-accepting chemotaxis protein
LNNVGLAEVGGASEVNNERGDAQMKIRTKATITGVLAVVVSIVIVTATVLALIRTELTRQAYASQDLRMRVFRELLQQKGTPKVVDNKLQFGDYVVNGNYDIVDKVSALTGGSATIFLGDTRISTDVLKDDGSRAVGTPLVGVAKDVVLNRGQSYRGEAEILGVPYFTAYDPLISADGRPYGVLYVGVKQSDFFRSFRHLVSAAVIAAVVLAVVFGLLMAFMTGRLLGRLATLAKAADSISVGDSLDTPLISSSQDEIGELSKSLDRLRESMRAALKRLESMA